LTNEYFTLNIRVRNISVELFFASILKMLKRIGVRAWQTVGYAMPFFCSFKKLNTRFLSAQGCGRVKIMKKNEYVTPGIVCYSLPGRE
jgi:hypothetical protein